MPSSFSVNVTCFSWKKPTAIRYPNMATEESSLPIQQRELGVGEILSEGCDILLLSLGHMNLLAMKVKERLQIEGIDPTVVDPIFVKPLDTELLLRLISTHKYIITLEEHSIHGGLGTSINTFIAQNNLSPEKIINLAIPDIFLEQGSYRDILAEAGLTEDLIYKTLISELSNLLPSLAGAT